VDTLDTFENPKGIIAVSADKSTTTIAYPYKTKGYVAVKSYEKTFSAVISAHESTIAYLALNSEGSLLATASDKGTLIRIFRTDTGDFLQELRRGTEKAEIYSICFNPSSKFLACSSDRGTIHIFSLATSNDKLNKEIKEQQHLEKEAHSNLHQNNENKEQNNKEEDLVKEEISPKNQKSFLSVFKKLLPLPKYFSSEWSFAQFRIPDLKSICAFSGSNTIIVLSADGVFYQGTFDTKTGGECGKMIEVKLSKLDKNKNN